MRLMQIGEFELPCTVPLVDLSLFSTKLKWLKKSPKNPLRY